MSTFDIPIDFQQIRNALGNFERTYVTGGAKAVNDIEKRLEQFSKSYPLPTVRGVVQQFPGGNCLIAVNDALDASNRRVAEMLAGAVQGLDFSMVQSILMEAGKEIAMYLGGGAVLGGTAGGALGALAGGVGAVPGAVVGAQLGMQIGSAIMTLMGLADLVDAFVSVVPLLIKPLIEGFALAVRAGMLPDNQRAQYPMLMKAATECFAQGKFILVIGLMAAVAQLLLRKGLAPALEKVGGSKLGKGFAGWMKKNQKIIEDHPALKPKSRAAAQGPAKGPSQEKPAPAKSDAPKPKEKETHNEGQAEIECPLFPRAGRPVNPISGSKILADDIDLDFSLPAAMPLVWQRAYSSAQRQAGWLGSGWSTPLSLALEINVDSVVVLDAFARGITFSLPGIGESLYSPSEKITLVRKQDRSFELVYDKGARDLFASSDTSNNIARLVGQLDANGNRITVAYNQRQLPERVEDSAGRGYLLAFEDHRGYPRLRSIAMQPAEPDGDTELLVEYEYDASGNLAKVSNGKGDVTRQFAYRNHVMVEHSQPGGVVSRYEYDEYAACGKVMRNWTNSGLSWSFRYLEQETVVTDNLGREDRYRFDAKRRFIGMVDAAGGVTTRRLDSNGNLLGITDPGGRSVSYRYDQRGRVTRIETDGNGTGIVYDNRFNKPALITDALGATTALRYDEFGNLASVTDALGQRTSYQYDEHGLPVKVTDAAGGVKRLEYNRAAQLISYTDCSNNRTHFSYDDQSRLIRTTDAAGNVMSYSYDRLGHLTAAIQPDGAVERYEYDALGRLVASFDPAGNRTSYVLDIDGKPVRRIDARGGALEYRYDDAHRIVELINENGDAYRFVYDALDRVVEETCFDATLTRYHYNNSGLVVAKEEYGGSERAPYTRIDTHYSRDNAGQLIEKIISRTNGAASTEQIRLRFAYDPVGRMTQAINSAAEVTLQYDALGQLVGERTETREHTTTLSHAYDDLGNRIQTTLPDGRVLNNLYYGSGHLHQINIDGEVITDIERDKLHRAVSRTQGSLTSQFQYDPVGRLLTQLAGQLQVGQNTEPVIARHYEYDETGNLLAIDDKRNGLKTYSYDAIGRIMTAVQPTMAERFDFDPAHNLLDTAVASAGRVEGNRVKVFEDNRYDYDSHGNLIEKLTGKHTRLRLKWNAAHQLVESKTTRHAQEPQPTVQKVKYVYDPFGRRIAKKDEFGTTRFAWDGNRLLCESRGQWERTYIYDSHSFVPLAQVDTVTQQGASFAPDCSVHYMHTDHLGTPNEITDQHGEIFWAVAYKTWGNVLRRTDIALDFVNLTSTEQNYIQSELAQAQPIRFQGQYHDTETGLHYNRFRYYDADCGRFVSLDPIGLSGGNNMYQYAANPIVWIDPLGLATNLFRGDDKYKGNKAIGPIGKPISAKLTLDDIVNHVAENGDRTLTSFSEQRTKDRVTGHRGADHFSEHIVKVSKADIAALEASGQIKTYDAAQVKEMLKADPKYAKKANNVYNDMKKNNEVLVHGQIPEANISRCK
ncbi:type IV secretion protein Rhs [Massilia sp. CCM 8733]|uniref:Type IV secretion protein Rhs n=1 Tax=Massilia mucilaginosa TaxID=2609282 RepID=A0ABX0P490_9BURK|nr:RHS repeat-associated core domain-containing protein [Massilia mucilaginosa]NHZ93883.1 type IV secretion protein Rhs [Massilia mucilaginosa]